MEDNISGWDTLVLQDSKRGIPGMKQEIRKK